MPVVRKESGAFRDLTTGQVLGGFIPGVTIPFYERTADFTGAKNVGAFGSLGTYTGALSGGIYQLTEPLYENLIFNAPIEPRAAMTIRNCIIRVPKTYVQADSIKACVRTLNGANTDNIVLEDCEIHNLAQRPFNGVSGRNITLRRTVITGCVDPFSESPGGSAPSTSGKSITMEDCIVPGVAGWYSPTINPDIHSADTISHSDVIQKSSSALLQAGTNCVFLAYLDEFIGTGTPGSGSETNPYAPPSGFNFIASQAQQEAWRDEFLNNPSVAAQSYGGVSRRRGNGSLAAVMLNKDNLLLTNCILDGGNATVNAVDGSMPTVMAGGFVNCTFYNGMGSGPSTRTTDPTVKGNAILTLAGKSWASFSGNKHPDGTPLVSYTEGGYRVWR